MFSFFKLKFAVSWFKNIENDIKKLVLLVVTVDLIVCNLRISAP